ncbi:hypothetical protein PTTG_04529 [Puccinia triticina 1-1 BBBD Race 1]|uniref:Tethering factor for nuclear proteasome STS1 n=1 Tax=Puccinia triticina (isolate 1-1 / race 1 (BBBD)) TaxID=630390 RepID=A0A180H3N0_PUCT1|nr:hypothetical protein PTTG_04529 [Puccinia triticina 1-1 BBBD Race 1]
MSTTHPPVIPVTMTHQVPFRQPAVTVPLNWSFAGTPPNQFPPNSFLRKEQHPPLLQAQINASSSFSNKSRKRSASDELDPDSTTTTTSSSFPLKSISALPKRTKRASPNTPSPEGHDGFNPQEDQAELGTALVSLTKSELVSLIHGLIQQKPELKPTIKGLLPPPSLESILAKLDEVEKQLVESIPNKRMNREEYIWNRVRVPLTSYVNDCMGCLELAAKTIENRCGGSGTGGKPELSVIYGAVSDQLSLLSHLSLSISKVESLLPSLSPQPSNQNDQQDLNWNVSYPFQSILIPSLFQNWKTFIEAIHKLIFEDRMIISESLIRKWFSLLDGLSDPHPSADHQDNHTVQRLMIAVRDEALNRFGILVGLKR